MTPGTAVRLLLRETVLLVALSIFLFIAGTALWVGFPSLQRNPTTYVGLTLALFLLVVSAAYRLFGVEPFTPAAASGQVLETAADGTVEDWPSGPALRQLDANQLDILLRRGRI